MTIQYNRHRDRVFEQNAVSTLSWGTPVEYNRTYERRTIDDVNTPNYWDAVKAGEVIINPLDLVVETMFIPDDVVATSNGLTRDSVSNSARYMHATNGYVPQTAQFIGTAQGSLPGKVVSLNEGDELELKQQLALAFVDKPQYGFGEDFAEMGETVRFITDILRAMQHPIKTFRKKVDQLKSGKNRIQDAAKRAEAIATLWAQYSFALRPLVQSVIDAIDALQNSKKLSMRRTSRSKSTLYGETLEMNESTHLHTGNIGTVSIANSRKVEFHVGVIYDAPQREGISAELRAKLGIRNKDLITTAWEVIPLSFMLDRILTVKNSITGMVNLLDPTVNIKGAFIVRKWLDTHIVQYESLRVPDGETLDAFSPSPHVHQFFQMKREEWIPNLSFTMPLFNPKELIRDASACADLASITTLLLLPLLRDLTYK